MLVKMALFNFQANCLLPDLLMTQLSRERPILKSK
uniref:Uncharacterized protein n=1 Tax=Anguilla anguilla TaxID=7936 RepID=A0A0E9U9S2_ANGAN